MLDVDQLADRCELMVGVAKMVIEAAETADDAAKMVVAEMMVIEAAEKTEVAAMKMETSRERAVSEVYDNVEGEMNAALQELKSSGEQRPQVAP